MAEPTQWLQPDEQKAWRGFILGTQLLMDRLDRDLRLEHGISMAEYEILVRLSEAPDGRMRMALLADALCHSRSRITHAVARMERGKLLERSPSGEDGRGVDAIMTEQGRRLLAEAAPTHVAGVRRHLVDLAGPEDFPVVGRVMNDVSDRLLAGKPASADVRQD